MYHFPLDHVTVFHVVILFSFFFLENKCSTCFLTVSELLGTRTYQVFLVPEVTAVIRWIICNARPLQLHPIIAAGLIMRLLPVMVACLCPLCLLSLQLCLARGIYILGVIQRHSNKVQQYKKPPLLDYQQCKQPTTQNTEGPSISSSNV